MNRTTLQALSIERIDDTKALLAVQRWSGAYYLAGYAVELALKSAVLACIERTGRIFTDKKYAEKCWTHDVRLLLDLADLTPVLAVQQNTNLASSWKIVADWNESSRYNLWTQSVAERLVIAVDDPAEGVLSWLKAYW